MFANVAQEPATDKQLFIFDLDTNLVLQCVEICDPSSLENLPNRIKAKFCSIQKGLLGKIGKH